jgi:hypothetical protein
MPCAGKLTTATKVVLTACAQLALALSGREILESAPGVGVIQNELILTLERDQLLIWSSCR